MTGYIIKLVLCSGILLLAYIFLFEKEKMHRFNRWYLLLSLAFPLLVPFINLEGQQEVIPFSDPVYVAITDAQVAPVTVGSPALPELKNAGFLIDPIVLIYAAVTAFLLFRFIRNLTRIVLQISTHEKVLYQNSTLVLCSNIPAPYTFFNYIFVDKAAYEKGNIEKEILRHELTHVRQKHSADIVFTELVLCFTWFNPFMWTYKRSIQLNHEFLADKAVIETFQNTTSYQYLLLEKVSQSSHSMLTSSFNYLITKKRLIMMTKNSSPFTMTMKQLVIFPLLALLIFLFSTKLVAQVVQEPVKKNPAPAATSKDTTRPSVWSKRSIGHTEEGVSPELLKEYQDIIGKYQTSDTFNWKDYKNITQEDRARLETIFIQMSIPQQNAQLIVFTKPIGPLRKVVPTANQFDQFKKAEVYGVWIDEKRVPNNKLNEYKNTDFSQVFVSKLYGPAKKGRNYNYQVNLMTNAYYDAYRKEVLERSKRNTMLVVRRMERSTGMYTIN